MATGGGVDKFTVGEKTSWIKNLMVKKTQYAAYKTLFHILVEMLQNVMHHGMTVGDKKEGLFTIAIDRQQRAGEHGPVVCEHGTAPARPPVARNLRPRQAQGFPQGVGEGVSRIDLGRRFARGQLMLLPVDRQSDARGRSHRFLVGLPLGSIWGSHG